jgi:hypothetical protein
MPITQEHRHRLEELKSTPKGTEGRKSPQQPPTPTDTAPPTGEPPLHLGHETGPHLSARPAEVTNRHRQPPSSYRARPQETNFFPST